MFTDDEIALLKEVTPLISYVNEGGYNYIYIPDLALPVGCNPSHVDALLCPQQKDGYSSRLFFSAQITGCPPRNWNGNIRILNRNWYALSWQVSESLNLVGMLSTHLKALRHGEAES